MSRQPFNQRWAQSVETENSPNTFKDPGSVRIGTGWEGGSDKDAPPAGEENWWHNRVDSALQGIERTGVMSWSAGAIYAIGAPTYGADGNFYESLVANNSGNNPTSSSGYWRYVGPSFFTGHEPGDVKMVAHNLPPSPGWLKCNGPILLRASYPRLFQKIGTTWNTGGENNLQFRGPDYRGDTPRAFDDGRGIDPGRIFGTRQRPTSIRTAASDYFGGDTTGASSASGIGYSSADSVDTSQSIIDKRNGDNSVMIPEIADNAIVAPLNSTAISSGANWISMRVGNFTANYWIKY